METLVKKSNEYTKLLNIIDIVIKNKMLKKIVFASPMSSSLPNKAEGVIFEKGGNLFLGLTKYTADNKADRKNIPLESSAEMLCDMAIFEYKRTNIITPAGDCSVMISKKGRITILDKIKHSGIELSALDLPIQSHNKQKNYIITPENSSLFLTKLGICSADGRIHDKKMSKFRQINKFLEIVEDIYTELPAEGTLNVCDLCCGKSYLSFAVYHFLTAIKGRQVKMYAVDLKADVIAFCSDLASQLGYQMEFICDDISNFKPDGTIHMVVSLHACDIATDIVL
ncbi:MAG: methyltransferase, partial [Ruminococcaceae bacterium]|nr:methyltransferase [Oscillospiraceae bacterium]